MICVSVCAETVDKMIASIKRAEEFADVIELRFDCLRPDLIETLISEISRSAPTKPLIATFREPAQGGNNSATLDERKAFWSKPRDVFWAADIEADLFKSATGWTTRLLSFHDLDKVPSDFEIICDQLFSINAGITKIAVATNEPADAIPVWKLLSRAQAPNKQIIPIAMGEAGKWTRILGLAHGAYMTYASLEAGGETASGQITAKDSTEIYRVKELDLETKVYGVIGDPVSESLSPYIHNPAFVSRGIKAVFIPFQLKNLDEFIRRMVRHETREVELNFGGFSVTMPHKQTTIEYLDAIDPTAEQIGAVNTVKIDGDKLIGYNTDAGGFIEPLRGRFGELSGARIAILGAGGAARACVYVLNQENAYITVFARDQVKAAVFGDEFNVDVEPIDGAKLCGFDIIVNATPLGMKGPLENESLFTAEQLNGVKFVYDLVTRADDTPIIREAKMAGIMAIGGLEMLVAQGAKQFEIWTGQAAPIEKMREAVTAGIQQLGR